MRRRKANTERCSQSLQVVLSRTGPGAAELDGAAGDLGANYSTAYPVAGFEYRDIATGLGERTGRHQTGHASPHHNDVYRVNDRPGSAFRDLSRSLATRLLSP